MDLWSYGTSYLCCLLAILFVSAIRCRPNPSTQGGNEMSDTLEELLKLLADKEYNQKYEDQQNIYPHFKSHNIATESRDRDIATNVGQRKIVPEPRHVTDQQGQGDSQGEGHHQDIISANSLQDLIPDLFPRDSQSHQQSNDKRWSIWESKSPAKQRRCGTSLKAPIGTISSPGYSTKGKYETETICEWKISAPKGKIIQADFAEVDIEASENCIYDFVAIYNGPNDDAPLLGKFCGSLDPFRLESTGNTLFVRFKSDESNVGIGFRLDYKVADPPILEEGCGGKMAVFTKNKGFISSPGLADNKEYPPYSLCTWIIQAKKGMVIKLTTDVFDVEDDQPGCNFDSLSIYDGSDQKSSKIGSYCGTDPGPGTVIESTGNTLFVQFTSDFSMQKPGFRFSWVFESDKVVKEHIGCGPNKPATLSETEGFISSPHIGPKHIYPNNADCAWKLEVPKGKVAHLHFTNFSIEDSYNCNYDQLAIFDGPDSSYEEIGRYCSDDKPGDITGTSNFLYVAFQSDDTVGTTGFTAEYSAKKELSQSGPENIENEVKCGRSDVMPKFGRIVGGQEAVPHSWPWQVSLRYRYYKDFSHYCGGSIIAPEWIITAAHCIKDGQSLDFKVVVGDHSQKTREPSQQRIDVAEIMRHEKFDANTMNNDIALMRLAKPIVFNRERKPVCLPRKDVEPNKLCVATGWGRTMGTGNELVLNQVYVPVREREECNQKNWYEGHLTENMICAGYPEGNKDTCKADSGGPLVCKEVSGEYTLYGLTSWGVECALAKHPGIYTRVSQYIDWMYDKIEKYQFSSTHM